MNEKVKKMALALLDMGAIKTGSFVLKSGITSPLYIDLREVVSFPQLLNEMADLLWEKCSQLKFDLLCGVPYTAIPFATALSLKHNIPMILRRKEKKSHGLGRSVEGHFEKGSKTLVVEDLVTSGMSIMETIADLKEADLSTTDIVCFLDREGGGKENLAKENLHLHAVVTLSELIGFLYEQKKVSEEVYLWVKRKK